MAKKLITLFPLKGNNIYPSDKIYQGYGKCRDDYIGEH